MISIGEIQKKALQLGVRDNQIEKDYILSWILYALSKHKNLSKALAFKGGTLLKKVYFENYRFSEDLDFTLLSNDLNYEQIYSGLQTIIDYAFEVAGIPLEILNVKESSKKNVSFNIGYVGPLGGVKAKKKIKVDISMNEKLFFSPQLLKVFLNYSDQKRSQLLCYTLEEVLIEKLLCVMQRMHARDLYDIWYLLEIHGINVIFYLKEFKTKCQIKGMNSKDFHKKLDQKMPKYKASWEKSLSSQLKLLPEFTKVAREIMRHLSKLQP